jgi:hypothetical protein
MIFQICFRIIFYSRFHGNIFAYAKFFRIRFAYSKDWKNNCKWVKALCPINHRLFLYDKKLQLYHFGGLGWDLDWASEWPKGDHFHMGLLISPVLLRSIGHRQHATGLLVPWLCSFAAFPIGHHCCGHIFCAEVRRFGKIMNILREFRRLKIINYLRNSFHFSSVASYLHTTFSRERKEVAELKTVSKTGAKKSKWEFFGLRRVSGLYVSLINVNYSCTYLSIDILPGNSSSRGHFNYYQWQITILTTG